MEEKTTDQSLEALQAKNRELLGELKAAKARCAELEKTNAELQAANAQLLQAYEGEKTRNDRERLEAFVESEICVCPADIFIAEFAKHYAIEPHEDGFYINQLDGEPLTFTDKKSKPRRANLNYADVCEAVRLLGEKLDDRFARLIRSRFKVQPSGSGASGASGGWPLRTPEDAKKPEENVINNTYGIR